MSDTTDITTEQTKSDIKTDTITTESDTETTNDEQVNTDSPTGYDGEKEYNEYSGEETDSEDTDDKDTDDKDTDDKDTDDKDTDDKDTDKTVEVSTIKTVADYRRELYTQQIEVKVLMNTYDKSDSRMKSIIIKFDKYQSLYNSYSDDIKKELKNDYDSFVSEYDKWYVENTAFKRTYKSSALLIGSGVSCCLLSIVCAIVIIVLSKRH